MKARVYCPDIECESCVKILTKALSKLQGVSEVKIEKAYLDVEYDDTLIKVENIIAAIKDKGYRASLKPYSRMGIRDRAKEFLKDKKKYHIEYEMIRNIIVTFLVLILLNIIGLYITLKRDASFMRYSWWLFYLTLSVVSVGGAIWHFKTYRTQYTCMVGMMIGMTLGMQTGMMIGAVLGATNGFFVGAMTGMLLGCLVGAYCGKCCGIMGIMEGLMAGVMGGTMGSMISVMMFTDHLLWFMPFYMAINVAILIGLSFMIYEEVVEENENIIKTPMHLSYFIAACTIIFIALAALMMIAPKSVFL